MFKNFLILRYITSFILPYILGYSVYIQLNGDVSPGGGFQGGVIFATAIVGYDFIYNIDFNELLLDTLIYTAVLGFLTIGVVSIVPMFLQGVFMEYSLLSSSSHWGQHLGIFFFELGIGITVASIITMIFFSIKSLK